jgi:hypothetical protein
MLTADAGGADALHGPEEEEEALEDEVDDEATEENDDEPDDDEAAAGLESLLHAVSDSRASAVQLNAADRRNTAIGAVCHRR